MKSVKKLISGVLSTTMLLSSINIVSASKLENNASATQSEVYCTYLNTDGQMMEYTMQELEAGNWDETLLDGAVPIVYEDFPARVESEYNNFAELSVNFTYLKTLGNSDTAVLTVTDNETGTELISDNFTADDVTKTISNIPIDKTYSLSICEVIDGTETEYSAVITTQYESADMPGNVSVYGRPYSGEDVVEKVVIREKSRDILYDESGNEIPKEHHSVLVSELPAFYQNMPSDKLYTVETSLLIDGDYQRFTGFINKANALTIPEIFVPTHRFYDTVEDAAASASELKTVSEYTLMNTPSMALGTNLTQEYTQSELDDLSTQIKELRDKYINMPTQSHQFFWYQVGDTERYNFRVISNYSTFIDRWIYYGDQNGQTPETVLTCNHTESESTTSITIATLMDSIIYLRIGNSRSGKVVFTAQRVYDDDYSNSIYDLEQANTRTATNTELDGCIDYIGDTDVFYLNPGSAPAGRFGVKIDNQSNESDLNIMVCYKEPDGTMFYDSFDEKAYVGQLSEGAVVFDYNPSYIYFIMVVMKDYDMCGDGYTIELVSSNKLDSYETAGGNSNNNTVENALFLDGTSGTLSGLTLHKSDEDWFGINSGSTGANITVTISSAGYGYNTYADDENTTDANCIKKYYYDFGCMTDWEEGDFELATWSGNSCTYTISNVEPNKDIYFGVTGSGSNYSPAHAYSLTYSIEPPTASNVAEIPLSPLTCTNSYYDWAYCAVMAANVKRTADNLTASTVTPDSLASYIYGQYYGIADEISLLFVNYKASLPCVAVGANYAYWNGATQGQSLTFTVNNVSTSMTEDYLFERVSNGETVILYLNSISSPSTNSGMNQINSGKYVLLCGVNKDSHLYKIIDPTTNTVDWYSSSGFTSNGGAMGNNDLSFTGAVIEVS